AEDKRCPQQREQRHQAQCCQDDELPDGILAALIPAHIRPSRSGASRPATAESSTNKQGGQPEAGEQKAVGSRHRTRIDMLFSVGLQSCQRPCPCPNVPPSVPLCLPLPSRQTPTAPPVQ